MRGLCYLVIAVIVSLGALAQDDSTSLADAARKSRENKPQTAKKVVTDENLQSDDNGPIPALNLDRDNTADVIKAIGEFKWSHKPEETERVVREWYNRYDQLLQRVSNENAEIRSRQEDRRTQPRMYPNDPNQYREQMLSEQRSAIQDEKLLKQNGMLAGRIQSAFYKVRSEINSKYRLNYEWLKPSSQYW